MSLIKTQVVQLKVRGRVDYFLGTGKIAGDRAGVTVSNGQLYYLLLKDNKDSKIIKKLVIANYYQHL